MKNRYLFVDDIRMEGSYFALIIRSPIAQGHLKGFECPQMPSSYTLVKADDIPGLNQLEDFSVPILASDVLSYIGEPTAILLGPDEGKLREYAAQCRVIADEEPPVFSSHIGSPQVILEERNISIIDGSVMPFKSISEKQVEKVPEPERTGGEEKIETLEEIALTEHIEIPKYTIGAGTALQGVYTTGIQEHWYAEPQGATAVFSKGTMTVYTASQWPFHVKRSLSKVLDIPSDAVRVELSCIGIHLDGKIWYPSLIACHAALGAFITKKPVKLVLTREEDFRYTPKRNRTEIEIRSTLGDRGELLETEMEILVDLGAQGVFTNEILDRTCLGCLGAYKLGPVKIRGAAVKTNIPPQGPFSGFGLSQGFFALERQVSRIADTLHQDPAEWRKNHVLRGGTLAIGVPLEDPPLEQLIDATAAMGDYYRKWAAYELLRSHRRISDWQVKDEPLRGIGIALAYQGSDFLYNGNDQGLYSVETTLHKDGFLEIKTSLISSNNDTYVRIWREMAAEILAIEGELVRIRLDNIDMAPDSGPGSNSRNIAAITHLVKSSCRTIQKQRLQNSPPIKVHQFYKPALKRPWKGRVSIPVGHLFNEQALTQLSWGAAVVEVEIDPVEYIPHIRGVWLGVDGGRIMSEERARLILTYSAVHALGWAAQEQLYYTDGNIPDPLIYHYDIPAPLDIPPIHIGFIRKDDVNPRGIGELPFSTIPAAYIQAVSQAMDHPFEKIPLSARDIWETGKFKKKETGL